MIVHFLSFINEIISIYFSFTGSYYSEYECNVPLLEKARLDATSSMNDRGANNAVLYGKTHILNHFYLKISLYVKNQIKTVKPVIIAENCFYLPGSMNAPF